MHVSLLAALLALAPGSRSQEEPRENDAKVLEAMPSNAMIAISIGSLDSLRERAKANDWVRMLEDEEFAPFFAKVGELVDSAFEQGLEVEREEAQRIADPRAWLAALHGSASFFFTPSTPFIEGDATGGVFLEVGEERAALDQLLDDSIEMLREEGSESALDYAGVDLTLFELAKGEATYVIFFESSGVCALLVGDRREEVVELAQGAIDRLSGKAPELGLASSERLAAARAASGPGRAVELLVDVGTLVRFGEAGNYREAAQLAGTEVTEPEPNPIAERFGLYDIRWLHLGADIDTGESADFHMALHLPEQSLLHQASRFFGPAPRELFALAPSDCLSAQVGNLDVPGLWEFVLRTLEQLAPENYEAFSAGLEQIKVGMGIDVEGGLIEQISGDFVTFTMNVPAEEVAHAAFDPAQESHAGEESSRAASAFGYAYLVALEDGVAVEDFLERVLEIGGLTPMIEFEEFQGHHLQSIEDFGLHWCFLDEFVAFAETPTPLRTALTRLGVEDAPSILSEERYRSALEGHPNASFLQVGDSRAITEAWLGILDTALGAPTPIELEGHVDPSSELRTLLPDPAIVRKYLSGVSTNALEVGTESLRFTMRAR